MGERFIMGNKRYTKQVVKPVDKGVYGMYVAPAMNYITNQFTGFAARRGATGRVKTTLKEEGTQKADGIR